MLFFSGKVTLPPKSSPSVPLQYLQNYSWDGLALSGRVSSFIVPKCDEFRCKSLHLFLDLFTNVAVVHLQISKKYLYLLSNFHKTISEELADEKIFLTQLILIEILCFRGKC